MSILRDFERRLEGAFEGFFARAFRSGLQPVELAKALQRYPNNYQQVGLDGIIVPNVYRFTLSADDLERFGGYTTALQKELADVVVRTADERGWLLKGRVRIEFTSGENVRVGTYELRGKIESKSTDQPAASRAAPGAGYAPPQEYAPADADRDEASPRPPARSGDTRIMAARPTAALVRVEGDDGPPTRLEEEATFGRLPDCDVRLRDASVSRRHARIARADGTWSITDLDSTNGVKVNGRRVTSASLADGDTIELGKVRLVFTLEA